MLPIVPIYCFLEITLLLLFKDTIIMKKALFFLTVPVITVLSRIYLVNEASQVISFGLFILIDFVISLIIFIISNEKEFDLSKSIILAVFLAVIDQLLKIVINIYDFKTKLVGELLRIEPTKNLNQTAMFNLFSLEFDRLFIIIFKAVLVVIILFIFIKINSKSKNIWCAFVLLLTASLSNFIDSIAWGYTLDYLYFYKLTCYDLKDFFVDTGVGFIIIELFSTKKNTKEVKK